MIVNEISLVIQNKNSLARKLTAGACVLHIFYLSSSFLFHVYLQRKRKINIRRNKKEERRVGDKKKMNQIQNAMRLKRLWKRRKGWWVPEHDHQPLIINFGNLFIIYSPSHGIFSWEKKAAVGRFQR